MGCSVAWGLVDAVVIGQGGQRGAARRYAVVARQRLIVGGVLCFVCACEKSANVWQWIQLNYSKYDI